MKVYAVKLLIFFNPVGIHFLWLIVQLVALRENITARFSTEARHNTKILVNTGCGGIWSLAAKNSSNMTASSSPGSRTTSSPGSHAEPSIK
jgi:hypothetical protein